MTTERFIVDTAGTLIDIHTRDIFDYVSDVCHLLNELHEEKEQLQHDATILIQSNQDYRKENEQLKQRITELELLNDGLNYALKNIRKIDVEIDVGDD